MKAYCWRTGKIEIGKACPEGALLIASDTRRKLDRTLGVLARHGYQKGLLLVPGVPEAVNSADALEAVLRFSRWVRRDLRERRTKRKAEQGRLARA